MNASSHQHSGNPEEVPEKIRIFIGDIGPQLADAARHNGRTLSAEIRARLLASLERDPTETRKK